MSTHDVARSTAALRDLIGERKMVVAPKEIRFETKKGAVEGTFVRAARGQQIGAAAGGTLSFNSLVRILLKGRVA